MNYVRFLVKLHARLVDEHSRENQKKWMGTPSEYCVLARWMARIAGEIKANCQARLTRSSLAYVWSRFSLTWCVALHHFRCIFYSSYSSSWNETVLTWGPIPLIFSGILWPSCLKFLLDHGCMLHHQYPNYSSHDGICLKTI